MRQRSIHRVLLGLGLLAALGCGSSSQNQRAEDAIINHESPYAFHRSIAYTLLRTGNNQKASLHARLLVKMRPALAEPYYILARAYVGLGLHEAAQAVLGDALRREPRFVPAVALRGVLLDLLDRHEEAERWHRRALRLNGKSTAYFNNLGFCLYLQGRFEEALATYREALKYDTGDRRLHNNLGFTYGRLGNMDAASRHFMLAGGSAATANNLGLVHETRGELDQALQYYELALSEDPSLAEAKGNRERIREEMQLAASAKTPPAAEEIGP